ncbi:hypothetical protein ACH4TV_44720 [Streptomyces sp. NPDC020898]|uniref:hypothetical protein n=1 Tax=Streptomyces sp. NPDC020898 TaxID=3365101 RepID=UPI0037A0052A
MMHILELIVICALVSCAVWAAATALLFLIGFGHLRVIRIVLRVRRGLAHMPAGVVFHSSDGALVLTAYNAAEDREKSVPVAMFGRPSLLRWTSGAARSKAALRRRTTIEVVWRSALFTLVTVPVFAVAGWLAITVDPLWTYAVLFLVAHQVLLGVTNRMFFIKYAGVTYLTGYLLLDRVGVAWHPSPSVAAAVYFGFVMVSMLAMGWVAKSEQAEKAGLAA